MWPPIISVKMLQMKILVEIPIDEKGKGKRIPEGGKHFTSVQC